MEREPVHDDDPAVAAAFLNRYLEDEAAGRARSLAEYRALFPGHRSQIEREYRALQETPAEPDAREDAEDTRARFGPYRVERELGRGGQGVVHEAVDTRLRRRVALKVLTGIGPGSETLFARFRREAEVASRLNHPGICAVYASGVERNAAYIAMAFVEGETLAAKVARARARRAAGEVLHGIELPETREDGPQRARGNRAGAEASRKDADPKRRRDGWLRIVRLFERAALALHAAHEAGVVHRDVKPGNVMVTPAGEPVLLDFGLARDEASDTSALTLTGDVFGTPAYMSPEQIAGDGLDWRTDVYSLGAALYECLTLERPFRAPTREALYQSILESEPADARELEPELPADLAVVLATALEKDLDRRYQTAEELALELARVRTFEPIFARPAGRFLRAWRFCQRNPALAGTASVAFLLLVLALAVAIQWLRTSEQSRANLVQLTGELEASLADARAGRRSQSEKRVQALVEEGYRTFFSGRWQGADRSFEAALAEDPANEGALAGLLWYHTYDASDALAEVDRIAARYGRAGASSTSPSQGSASNADSAREVLAADNASVVHWVRARILSENGRHTEAEREFALAGDESNDVRTYLEGLQAIDNFGYTAGPEAARAALPWFEKAVTRARMPQFHYWHSLMMAANRAGDRATVDRAADALVHHWPDSPSTWDAIAQFYFTADPERSLAAMHRILELEDSAMAHIGIAQHALARDDADLARAELERAVGVDPAFHPAHLMKASFHQSQGELDLAIAHLERAADLEPNDATAHAMLRAACEQAGDRARSLPLFRALAERHPNSPWANLELARLLRANGEHAAAVTPLSSALAAAPHEQAILEELRAALTAAGDARGSWTDDELRARVAQPPPAR